jgi:UDP-N-acetylmuramyl pentapeptide synthase
MPRDASFGVFEMGMNHKGELAALTRLVRPHVAIVTAIAPAHREYFASDEEIADAKAEIFEGLEPGGTAIIPMTARTATGSPAPRGAMPTGRHLRPRRAGDVHASYIVRGRAAAR